MTVVFPALATVVSAVFALRCWMSGRKGGRSALLVWSLALGQFAVASAALTWGVGFGWGLDVFRVYYLFGAILSAAWLGAGTVWLLGSRALAIGVSVALGLASLAVAAALWAIPAPPGSQIALTAEFPDAGRVVPPALRTMSRVWSFGGGIVVLAGLLWSIARARSNVMGLSLLSVGVVGTAVAGVFARLGLAEAFSATLAAGVAVMFLGFLRTR